MSDRTQFSVYSLLAPMQMLLIVALAVFLLSALGMWVTGLPVQTASAAVAADVTTPDPTAAAVADSPTPLATSEPTATPAIVAPTATPPADRATDQLSYTVREGDTLGAIAQAYRVPIEDLVMANDLVDPNLLYAGWTLVIPGGNSITSTPPISTAQESSSVEVPSQPTPVPAPASPEAIDEERWIDVDLSRQLLTAYEGNTPVHSYLVSTGLPATPTPVGQFRIWIKLRYDDMAGTDYYIEDVPFVMYFHEGYGLHGVTWHANFGHQMSHGCVNQPNDEAKWLFNFADVGTLVNIHG
jgi:lipoprotein-anchoring transpeptidase ErfK/SrfK